MRKEVDKDRGGQQDGGPERRIGRKTHVENPDHPRHVAANAGIHESRKQRHIEDLEHAGLRVAPGPGVDLEPFHRRAGQMDNPRLLPGFEFEPQKQDLGRDGEEEQRVVALQRPGLLPDHFGADDGQ